MQRIISTSQALAIDEKSRGHGKALESLESLKNIQHFDDLVTFARQCEAVGSLAGEAASLPWPQRMCNSV